MMSTESTQFERIAKAIARVQGSECPSFIREIKGTLIQIAKQNTLDKRGIAKVQ